MRPAGTSSSPWEWLRGGWSAPYKGEIYLAPLDAVTVWTSLGEPYLPIPQSPNRSSALNRPFLEPIYNEDLDPSTFLIIESDIFNGAFDARAPVSFLKIHT